MCLSLCALEKNKLAKFLVLRIHFRFTLKAAHSWQELPLGSSLVTSYLPASVSPV